MPTVGRRHQRLALDTAVREGNSDTKTAPSGTAGERRPSDAVLETVAIMKRLTSTLRSTAALTCLLATCAVACGGKNPAESPDSAQTDAAPAEDDADSSEGDADSGEAAKPAEPAAEAAPDEPSGPTPPRTPKDILAAPDVLFMFSFNDSDVKKDAEEKCEKSSKGDAKKNADCMANARKTVDHDGMGFAQDKSGQWVWTTIKRNGNVLVTLHEVPFEFGEETKSSITIKTTGKDTGKKPGKPPAKVTFGVPNDYQITVKDPRQGLMVYEAKIGITSQ
jgi:hypothetical protein